MLGAEGRCSVARCGAAARRALLAGRQEWQRENWERGRLRWIQQKVVQNFIGKGVHLGESEVLFAEVFQGCADVVKVLADEDREPVVQRASMLTSMAGYWASCFCRSSSSALLIFFV